MDTRNGLKREAAYQAASCIESGMVLGLGSGTTVAFVLERIAELLESGNLKNIVGIPSSSQIEKLARSLGVQLASLDDHSMIDLTIDGADEVDPDLNLIKGHGGALLREKILAQSSRREIIVVDDSKLSPALGTKSRLPVEVIPFGWRSQIGYLESLGAGATVRKTASGSLYRTDQGNLILDCDFGRILEPVQLAGKLKERAGIVEHGLFIDCASEVIVAGKRGIRHLARQQIT
jgi:ribose 5-phosphate isomerase A